MTPEMRAIVITRHGDPDVLREERLPIPRAAPGAAVVRVRAFGLNHAEVYFRRGIWGNAARVSGIECAGEVHDPGDTGLTRGRRVVALMGGLGRTLDGTYAEYARVPATNVVPIASDLDWASLAALPESYATAWVFLRSNLGVVPGHTIVVRGGTSALGQAAINVARDLGARVVATTRSAARAPLLEALGAEPLVDAGELAPSVRALVPGGADAVLEVVGTTTLADSLRMVRYGGRVAIAGFLGGVQPLAFDPLQVLPSGVHLSFFASAFVLGGPDAPLADVPFDDFAAKAKRGIYRAAPAHVFDFEGIVEAHRLMESGTARGKIVVRAPG